MGEDSHSGGIRWEDRTDERLDGMEEGTGEGASMLAMGGDESPSIVMREGTQKWRMTRGNGLDVSLMMKYVVWTCRVLSGYPDLVVV